MATIEKIGKYKIIKELGHGGMGIVYLAQDPFLARKVALKTLLTNKVHNPQNLKRIKREARIYALLDHPHIVKLFEHFEDNENQYLVMEYLARGALLDRIKIQAKQKKINLRENCLIFRQICQAVEYAHQKRIFHRDLTPRNILFSDQGLLKVTDFGLACLNNQHSITETGNALGTFNYSSPEQCRGREIDYRTDIYSLAVLFYELLTNQLPFIAESDADIIHKQIYDTPLSPRQYNQDIPEALEELILTNLNKDPNERHQSVDEIVEILNRFSDAEKNNQEIVINSGLNCPACNYENPSDNQHCGKCGELITRSETQSKNREKNTDNEENQLLQKGNGYFDAQQYEESLECYEQILKINPQNHIAWIAKGLVLYSLGRNNEVLPCYDRAIELKPNYYRAFLNKGIFLADLIIYDEALACLEKALEYNPQSNRAWFIKGFILINQEKYNEAIKCFEQAIRYYDKSYGAWNNMGNCYQRLGNHKKAIDCYNQAIKIDFENLIAWKNKYISLEAIGRNSEAKKCAEKINSLKAKTEELPF